MRWRSIYTYAWDLAEHGVPCAVGEFLDHGLNTVTMAGSYHAGKFLRPRASGKILFPEDGTVYFRHDPSAFGAIKPEPNSLLDERDVLDELCSQEGIAVNVWLVLLHNSLLGFRHPEACARNAFGDIYYYNLCPSASESREYAIGLARNVTESYPVAGISMESPGFAPFFHGYHHEFYLVRSNRWLENLLGLCFCGHCRNGARKAGIDIVSLAGKVADDISGYLASDTDYPDDMAESFWLADAVTDREFSAFLNWRCDVVSSLVEDIREAVRPDAAVAVIPSVARPTSNCWYEGSDLGKLAATAGIVEACFYEPSVARIRADLADIARRIGDLGELRGILRPSFPDLETGAELAEAVKLLDAGGVTGLSFYNWGFLRERNMRFIKTVLPGYRE